MAGMRFTLLGRSKSCLHNRTLTANGNATAISDSSIVKNAIISLELSVHKSTNSVVSMDIINGTLKIAG